MTQEAAGVADNGPVTVTETRTHPDGTAYQHVTTHDNSHTPSTHRAIVTIKKYLGDWEEHLLAFHSARAEELQKHVNEDGRLPDNFDAEAAVAHIQLHPDVPVPHEIVEAHHNLLTTVGAGDIWTGVCTAGLSVPYNSTNAQILVGDGSTSPTAADTDMGAAAGASLGGGITGASSATPIVLTTSTAHGLIAGQVVQVAAVGGNTAANGTWEVQAVTTNTITLLNSAWSSGAYTSGGTVKQLNRYAQLVSGAPTLSTNQAQFVGVFGTTHGNHAWSEWGVGTGGAATNRQAAPPPHLLDHAVPAGGLGTKTSASTWTGTFVLSDS